MKLPNTYKHEKRDIEALQHYDGMLKQIDKIHTHIHKMNTYNEKLEYLNDMFLKAKSIEYENMILAMIRELKFWGQ